MRAAVQDFERTVYLGYPMLVTADTVTVFERDGQRRLCRFKSVARARCFVRGYRRLERTAA